MNASLRILILGHGGMLGHMAVLYFRERCTVLTLERRFSSGNSTEYFDKIRLTNPNIVINGIGLIKQKSSNVHHLLEINSAFPLWLRLALPEDVLLIHPSTDCVYAGGEGNYTFRSLPNATDAYGLSKSLGEIVGKYPNTLVARTSVIGPEVNPSPLGLLGWFLAQPDGAILQGYTNHLWNGITTLEWCVAVDEIIASWTETGSLGRAIEHLGTEEYYSKADMLRLFSRIYNKNVLVRNHETSVAVDRRLVPTNVRSPLPIQLQKLRSYSMSVGSNSF